MLRQTHTRLDSCGAATPLCCDGYVLCYLCTSGISAGRTRASARVCLCVIVRNVRVCVSVRA